MATFRILLGGLAGSIFFASAVLAAPDRVVADESACPIHWHPGEPVRPYPHEPFRLTEAPALQDVSGASALAAARRWVEIGHFEAAIRRLADTPATPRANLYRALALTGSGRWSEAAVTLSLDDAVFPPGCGPVLDRARARTAAARGHGAEADRALDRLAAALPALGAYVDLWRLEAAARTGDVARGEATWTRIARSGLPAGARTEGRFLLASLYERAGHADRAAGLYRSLGREARGARRAERLLDAARAAQSAGRDGEADALRREAIAADAGTGAPLLLDPGTRARLGFGPLEAARTLFEAGRWEAAERLVDPIVAAGGEVGGRRDATLLRARIRAARGDRVGAERDFAVFLSQWPGDPRVPEALYRRGRLALSSGEGAIARARFENFLARFPSHDYATAALYLTADSYQDDRMSDPSFADRAIEAFDRLVQTRPGSSFADRAEMRAAHLVFALGRYAEAERRYASYRGRPSAREARYWRGRAMAARGEETGARAVWRSLAAGDDYYAVLARARLEGRRHDFTAVRSDRPAGPDPRLAAETSLLAHPPGRTAAALLSLGERGYAEAELARTVRSAGLRQAESWAPALVAWGFPHLALRIGVDRRNDRLSYVVGYAPAVADESRAHDVDPWWVLALIRQESLFDASAVSPAGALGLMQVMPSTGREIAEAIGWSGFDTARLLDPVVALHFGVYYLERQMERFETFWPAALAAYNGGPPAVARWWEFPERTLDPELWIDRIPYRETRDYVKKVVAQHARYRDLHGSGPAPSWD